MTGPTTSATTRRFLSRYFHQDWDLEADTWMGLIDKYVADEKPDATQLRSLARELEQLSAEYQDEDLRKVLVQQFKVAYLPFPDASRAWLKNVAMQLRDHIR